MDEIRVSVASPPGRDGRVAELAIHPDDESVLQFAELFRLDGRVMIGLYGPESGRSFDIPLSDFLEAIGRGLGRLAW